MNTNILAFPTTGDTPPTMSSREIAELTGKHHMKVLRDIRGMLETLGKVEAEFGSNYTASNGKKNPEFNLPKRETLILVSGYNVQMRAKIIDRWQELEAKQVATPQLTRSQQIAHALLLAHDEIQELTYKVKEREYALLEASPKVEFYETVVGEGNSVSLRVFSKMTLLGPNQLSKFLRNEEILMRRTSRFLGIRAYSEYMDNGWFVTHYEPLRYANGTARNSGCKNKTVWITPKGIEGLWQRYGLGLFTKTSTAARAMLNN